jgi:nitrogen fixation NifU-like protein
MLTYKKNQGNEQDNEQLFDVYERLISIYKNPKNEGKIEKADIVIDKRNISCGDEVTIYIKLKKEVNKKQKDLEIEDIKFKGKGCVISKAATSLLLEHLKGKKLSYISKLDKEIIFSLLNLDLSNNPTRINCATLALNGLKEYLKNI